MYQPLPLIQMYYNEKVPGKIRIIFPGTNATFLLTRNNF